MLREDQIYRIDHFLGKETVQSIMAVRFANGLFEPIWNREHIDHVQITVAETVGVEHRGKFYEQTGALRDMVPNHLFQLLTHDRDGAADELRSRRRARPRRLKFSNAIPPVRRATAPCAASTARARSRPAGPDYRQEPDVAPTCRSRPMSRSSSRSTTGAGPACRSTCAPASRWRKRWTEIAIQFRRAPLSIFQGTAVSTPGPEWLVLQIQPDEGISFQFQVKRPGQTVALGAGQDAASLTRTGFQAAANVGYETLIYDCMIGDATLFQRADMVEAGWRIVQPVLDAGPRRSRRIFRTTPPAAPAPKTADEMLAKDGGRSWRPIGDHI